MQFAEFLSRVAGELALFVGAGFLLFAVNDLLVEGGFGPRSSILTGAVFRF